MFVIGGALLISYSLSLPPVNAYFTDSISFRGSRVGGRGLNSAGISQLTFNVHRFTNLKMHLQLKAEEGILTAAINIPAGSGFDADDVIASSIEFAYSGQPALAIGPVTVETFGQRLELNFDWGEVERLLGADNDPEFELMGKGSGAGESGLGERFTFSGQGQITDLLSYFHRPEIIPLPDPELIELGTEEILTDGQEEDSDLAAEDQNNNNGDETRPAAEEDDGDDDMTDGGNDGNGSEATGQGDSSVSDDGEDTAGIDDVKNEDDAGETGNDDDAGVGAGPEDNTIPPPEGIIDEDKNRDADGEAGET
jgi:hypothetical protein